MGDGSIVHMTRSEIEADVRAGVEAAVKRAKTPPLAEDEIGHLVDIYASPSRLTGDLLGLEIRSVSLLEERMHRHHAV